ncbi:MAG: glutamate-5-semialdehyde dehydrogenase [Caulobacteraceae bacterium]
MTAQLTSLVAGMPIPYGGDRVTLVSAELAETFKAGDRLVVVQESGRLLHVPAEVHAVAHGAVARAYDAFRKMGEASDARITAFFEAFAARLQDERTWAVIAQANAADVQQARARGRSTTRLAADERMRLDMIEGLRGWRDAPIGRGAELETLRHEGWSVQQVMAPLGVVGFVFEGRPNVFADAAGCCAAAIRWCSASAATPWAPPAPSSSTPWSPPSTRPACRPARRPWWTAPSGRPAGPCSPTPACPWRWRAAPARRVAELGAVARQAGIPVSLHGTGGAWLVADRTADAARFAAVAEASLDRKVCNTLNVCVILRARAAELVPLFLQALHRAGERRGHGCKLHVMEGDEGLLPPGWLDASTRVRRPAGDVYEPRAEILPMRELGCEWEWEETPEVSLAVVDTLNEAIALFNRYSPQFVASLISQDEECHRHFFAAVNAPFVGDGFTRWVDGQYALNRPELGLSNWEHGRLFARGGVLAGDGVYTVRSRARQTDPKLRR